MVSNFVELIVRCYRIAAPYGKVRLLVVMIGMLLSGAFQVLGVSSVFPFFAAASDPEGFLRSGPGTWVVHHFPTVQPTPMLVFFGVLSIVAMYLGNAAALLSDLASARYAQRLGYSIRTSMMSRLEVRPYSYFLQRNSAHLLQKLTGDVGSFVSLVFQPLLEILSRTITFLLIAGLVCLANPMIAVGSVLLLAVFYFFVFMFLRPKIRRIGLGLWEHNRGQLISAQQFITGIKPIIVHDRAEFFANQFRVHAKEISKLQPRLPLFANTPRYFLEPLCFGGLIAIVVIFAWQGIAFSKVLPLLAIIALAGYKLLPTAQSIYTQLSNATAMRYTVDEIEAELLENERGEAHSAADEQAHPPGNRTCNSLRFEKSLTLDNVSFAYSHISKPALTGISFSVDKNESVGIVGTTGSGKTTLVDIILGLHRPTGGRILVDSELLSRDRLQQWRLKIGYVPQDIYLLDDSIAANIAFGVDPSQISLAKLRRAAEAAQILSFIETELPDGFGSHVGERGVRLSGGQRQRIGLARALYHDPQILLLDEATSALDGETETAVLSTIQELHGKVTMITIAHRWRSLDTCDRIFRIEKGKLSSVRHGERIVRSAAAQ